MFALQATEETKTESSEESSEAEATEAAEEEAGEEEEEEEEEEDDEDEIVDPKDVFEEGWLSLPLLSLLFCQRLRRITIDPHLSPTVRRPVKLHISRHHHGSTGNIDGSRSVSPRFTPYLLSSLPAGATLRCMFSAIGVPFKC